MNFYKVEKWVNDGYAITYLDGKTYFVKGAIPGESIEAEVHPKYPNKLILKKVIEPSPKRILSDCKIYLNCGGCSFRHLEYEEELEIKKNLLISEIKFRLGEKNLIPISLFFKNPNHYRNNSQFKILNSRIGFYKENSNEWIELPNSICKNVSLEILDSIKKIKFGNQNQLKLRTSVNGVVNYEKEITLKKVLDKEILIPKNGFFQINDSLVDTWIIEIQKKVEPRDSLIELFSGSGLVSLFIGDKFQNYTGYELDEKAVEFARTNSFNHSISHFHFYAKNLYKENLPEKKIDSIFTNPPRAGLGKKMIEEILRLAPSKVYYSSCNYVTLANDLSKLSDKYTLVSLDLFDFFPRTHYFESFVVLSRKS
jgi:23S rRNA (uracil1939-C5)-methyltransferase